MTSHLVQFAPGKRLGFLTGLGEEDGLAQIAEGGSATGGDAVGGEGFEDAFEGTMHVETGVGCGEKLADFGREILFDGNAAAVELGVRRQKLPEVTGMQHWRPSEN